MAALLFIVGAVAHYAITVDWRRTWRYATAFTATWTVLEGLRIRRRAPEVEPENLPPHGEAHIR